MTLLKGILLGIIQGISEFLPISSSGHLKLFQHLFGLEEGGNFFSVMLHVATLAAVVLVYYKLIWGMIVEFFKSIKDICTGKFKFNKMNYERRMMVMVLISTALLGFMIIPLGENSLKDYIEMMNNSSSIIPLAFFFAITGVLLLLAFRLSKSIKKPRKQAKVSDALIIGATQCVATISGISRSGSTVAAGLLCGLDREYMIQYSFILSIPAILAAALSDAKDVISGEIVVEVAPLIAGMIFSFVFGVLSIKMIQWLIRKDRYNLFGYYCLGIGALTLVLGLFGV